MSLDVEDKIRDIQERYRTLSMYDIEVGIHICSRISCVNSLTYEYEINLLKC